MNFHSDHIAPIIPMAVLTMMIITKVHCHHEVTMPFVKALISKPCAMCLRVHQQHGLRMGELEKFEVWN
jgi:hypothetical protein